MSLSQDVVIKNINTYLAIKNKKANLKASEQYSITQGLCAGLVAYWLYLMRNDEEGFFQQRLQYLVNWDAESFENSNIHRDETIEQFLDNVLLLSKPGQIISTARQSDLNISFELVLRHFQDQISTPEFNFSFIFNKAELQDLIPKIALENKMVRLSNGDHVIGLMLRNNVYTLYNPDSDDGPIETTDVTQLAERIFTGFSKYCKSKTNIAMNTSIYDMSGSEPGVYFDTLAYCSKQINQPVRKREILQHKFLFPLLAKYNNYETMDLLFDNGYCYTPDRSSSWTEINEAVAHGDMKKLKYLLQHGFPIDNRNLFLAIEQKSIEMVYTFIAAGANTNTVLTNNKTYLDLALRHDFPEAIVLLLASGTEVDERQKIAIQNKYSQEGMQKIFVSALQMQKSFLAIPQSIEIYGATGEILSNFAKHYKLAHQLDINMDNIVITIGNKVIRPEDTMSHILEIFINHTIDDMFSISEKAELESVLQYFYPGMQKKRDYAMNKLAESSMAAIQIAEQLSHAPANHISKIDIVNAQVTLENIATLSFELGIKPGIDTEAAQNKILKYFEQHHINANHPKSNQLFFSLNTTRHPLNISYDEDISGPLHKCTSSLHI